MATAPATPKAPTTPPPPPPARSNRSAPLNGTPQAERDTPRLAMPEAKFEPPRVLLNAVEGWGKTTAGAYAEKPAMLMVRGETGYLTLLGGNRVPKIPVARIENWSGALAMLDNLIDGRQAVKTLVIDALGGLERLCHEHVCSRDFKGRWGDDGFAAYAKGPDVSVGDWLQLLVKLDKLRDAHGTTILILSHAQIRPHANPEGPDFDRYTADCHKKTWAATARWADATLFGKFYTVLDEKRGQRAKGIGGTERVLYTEHRDAWDAKNRYGMPEMLEISDNPAETWGTIWNAITGGNDNA